MEAPSDEIVGLAPEGTVPDAPRAGQVLAERYEVLRHLDEGPLTVDVLALDQEREEEVLLRLVRGDGFAAPLEGRQTLRRLRSLVGAAGRFLAPLLDADREGAHIFAVEPRPRGVTFREVWIRRRASARRFSAEELLPLAARLEAALAAVPEGFGGGVLRRADLWVDEEGLRLHGLWVSLALPPAARRALLEMSDGDDLLVAPEVRRGEPSGPPADRFVAAALLWEAWTGRSPSTERLPPLGGDPVARALAALMRPAPSERPDSLREVLEALGEAAGLPVPELDPGAEPPRGPDLLPTVPGETEGRASAVHVRRVPGAASGGTVELSLDEAEVVVEEPEVAVDPERAATGQAGGGAFRAPGGDPSGTAEVSLDQIVEMQQIGAPASSRREPTDELPLEEAEVLGAMVTSEEGGGVVGGGGAEVQLPGGLKPVPRPRRDSGVGMTAPPLFDEEKGGVQVAPKVPLAPPGGRDVASAPARAAAPNRAEPSPGPRDVPSVGRMSSGWVVVAVAAFVAALIVAVALGVAAYRKAEQERERERRIRERIEQVRDGELPAPVPSR